MAKIIGIFLLIFLLQSFTCIDKYKTNHQNGSMKDRVIGIWAAVGEENANFQIKKTTIYYPDSFKSYKYTIVHDSLKIIYDDFEHSSLISFKGDDTLILKGEEEVVFIRFKN